MAIYSFEVYEMSTVARKRTPGDCPETAQQAPRHSITPIHQNHHPVLPVIHLCLGKTLNHSEILLRTI